MHHVSLCLSWSQPPPFHPSPLLPLSSICPECHNFYVKASRMSFITPLSPPPTCPSSSSFIRLSSMKKICATNLRPLCNGRRQAGACTLPHFMTVFSLLLPPDPLPPPLLSPSFDVCVFFWGTKYFYSSISICKEGCMTAPCSHRRRRVGVVLPHKAKGCQLSGRQLIKTKVFSLSFLAFSGAFHAISFCQVFLIESSRGIDWTCVCACECVCECV